MSNKDLQRVDAATSRPTAEHRHQLEVEYLMSPSPGVRPDLATRLRQSQRALKGRLAKPEAALLLMRAAHESLDPAKIGELVVARAIDWFKVGSCAVLATDLEGQVVPVASHNMSPGMTAAAIAIGRWVLAHGRDFATADLRRDGRVTGACGAVVAVPLRSRGRCIGALVLIDRATSAVEPKLSGGTSEMMSAVLEGPAMALDYALTLHRAEALSVTDDLTQLYNSRYLNQVLRREAKRASRSGRPLSLLFMDLDGFKGVNDVHGHLAGSRALVEAAAVIRGSARETDIAARFGGDEFSIVLPDTGSEGAVAVADRVRERIAAHPFLAGNGLNLRLTASVGVATLPDVAGSADELVRAADVAMYRIKQAGKNGVGIARGDEL